MIFSAASSLSLIPFPSATAAHSLDVKPSRSLPDFPSSFVAPGRGSLNRRRRGICKVVVRSDSETSALASGSTSTSSLLSEEEEEEKDASAGAKIGARIRVKTPLKVYHVPKVPEVDLTGMEGELKQYVGLWKGKRISANFPFKVQFVIQVEDRGPVKFFVHRREDEFDYL